MTFIQYMLVNYGKNGNITHLIDNTRMHIMPSMNPDGYERAVEGMCNFLLIVIAKGAKN